MYGLQEKHINAIKNVFKKYDEIIQAILYGSRAMGNFRKGSDIDLSLKGENLTLKILTKIENELDELHLVYKIDLSIYHKIENKDLIKHIIKNGIPFYEKEKSYYRKKDT